MNIIIIAISVLEHTTTGRVSNIFFACHIMLSIIEELKSTGFMKRIKKKCKKWKWKTKKKKWEKKKKKWKKKNKKN